jgi:hypothetical protein
MSLTLVAAIIFVSLCGLVCFFYIALAFGAPWGSIAMGGKYPGKLPINIRFACLLNEIVYGLFIIIILARVKLIWPGLLDAAAIGTWAIVGLLAIGILFNIMAPSRWERIIWAPVALLLLICAIIVGISPK